MMTTRLNTRTTMLLAVTVGLVLATTASASDWGFSIGFGRPRPVLVAPYPPPVAVRMVREWVPGHYETRSEQVLVSPAHYERQYVAPVYETRYEHRRAYSVCVRPGYWTEVYVPAQYETRYTQVFSAGYYMTAGVERHWTR